MKRVVCLIDGFNVYHAIHNNHPAHYKWCNYKALTECFLAPDEKLLRTIYFSALAKWDVGKVARHSLLIKALEHVGVEPVLGIFKKKRLRCRKCLRSFTTHEEKESDVNLAATLVSLAYEDAFDTVLIMSGDSDFISTINILRAKFPEKRVGVIIPGDPRRAVDIRKHAHFWKTVEREQLEKSFFPDMIHTANGRVIMRPPEYEKGATIAPPQSHDSVLREEIGVMLEHWQHLPTETRTQILEQIKSIATNQNTRA